MFLQTYDILFRKANPQINVCKQLQDVKKFQYCSKTVPASRYTFFGSSVQTN